MNSFEISKSFNALRKNLKSDVTGFRTCKLAILGDTSTQLLHQSIKGYGVEYKINFEVFEADYNQVDRQILDPGSEFYLFGAEYVLIYLSEQRLFKRYVTEAYGAVAESFLQKLKSYIEAIKTKQHCNILILNLPESIDPVFGNYGNKTKSSFVYQLRRINIGMMEIAESDSGVHIVDLSGMYAVYGRKTMFDHKAYYSGDLALSLDGLSLVSKSCCDIVSSLLGDLKKCLILDLDNTVWGGIIGDDGIERIQVGELGQGKVFTELQYWLKGLKNRGIILAVCSKNNEEMAKEPFLYHPEMILRLEDISVFVANWNNKADNIRYIQNVLNIGLDSMVFIDDNPAEREIVRLNLPMVTVPELPEDPALYLSYLIDLNLFETTSFSKEDMERTKLYKEEAGRKIEMLNHTNEEDFLKSLQMKCEVRSFDAFNMPRVAQLSQRSNQFNLRTQRYTEQDVVFRSNSPDYICHAFTLKDKFGDNGLIAVVVLKKEEKRIFIENWFMSCRVLKRSMENFTLNTIVKTAMDLGFDKIIGQYIETPKNKLVKDHYERLGFTPKQGFWELDTKSYISLTCQIEHV